MDGPERTVIDVLENKWWIGIVSLLVSLAITPVVRAIAYRLKVVDKPDQLLKPHGRPIAYLGGVAMCIGLLAGLGSYLAVAPTAEYVKNISTAFSNGWYLTVLRSPLWNLGALTLGFIVITLVGLLDDLTDLKPQQKVWGQLLAAAILMVGGIGIHMMEAFFSLVGISGVPLWIEIPLSAIASFILVVATCNATNLLDGLDGLCGGVTGIIALGFLGLAVWLAMSSKAEIYSQGTDELRVALCLAMAGAVIGFLPYNLPPASIFMGDAGSMLLGFFVAVMMVFFCHEGTARWFIGAWVIFALPTLDTALAVVRRLISGRSIFAGDRSHLYDQLVDRGMTVKRVVGLFYILALVSAAIGVTGSIFLRIRYAFPLYLGLFIVVWAVFWATGLVNPPAKECRQDEDDSEERGFSNE